MARLHVARDSRVTVVSRGRLRLSGGRLVRRPWPALVELTVPVVEERESVGLALVVVPPTATAVIAAAAVSPEVGVVAGAIVFFALSYLSPTLRRRRGERHPKSRSAAAVTLSAPAERAAFEQAVGIADRVSETWPRLGALIDPAEAGSLLAEALWGIAGVLARRQELARVLADLSRPDFVARSPADGTARELRAHLEATKAALAQLEIDLVRRLVSLNRAEKAGRDFIREQEMRRAIQAAADSLRAARDPQTGPAAEDAGADLAEHTRSVVDAYRELTAGLHTNPSP